MRGAWSLVGALAALCVSPWSTVVAQDSAVVLMYHRFGEDQFPSTNIRIEQFQAHLEHLRDGGYSIVPVADVHAAVSDGATLPDLAVAITIDDAYLSVYEVAFPMFQEFGFPFTVYVASNPVDDGLAAYMSWDQMREMEAAGVTFANHGADHRSTLDREGTTTEEEWLAAIRDDVATGARRLAEELEAPMLDSFAYPYGEYDTRTADLLQELGYVSFGQHSGAVGPHSDPRALPRYPMAEAFGDIGEFRTKVRSLPLPVLVTEPWDPLTTSTQPRIELTLAETDARLGELACFVSGQGRVDVEWHEENARFSVGPDNPFRAGRQRVNCTAPRNDGRYLWFSHPWIVQP